MADRVPLDMVDTHPEKRLIGYARVSTYGQVPENGLLAMPTAPSLGLDFSREAIRRFAVG